MAAIPPSIRKFLDSGRGEIHQLEHEYHIWFVATLLTGVSSILLIIVNFMLFTLENNEDLIIIRLLIGIVTVSNTVIFYIVFQEMQSKKRYLLEIQRLMMNGLSFLDSIRRGFKDMFGR